MRFLTFRMRLLEVDVVTDPASVWSEELECREKSEDSLIWLDLFLSADNMVGNARRGETHCETERPGELWLWVWLCRVYSQRAMQRVFGVEEGGAKRRKLN